MIKYKIIEGPFICIGGRAPALDMRFNNCYI